jgi:hypothetical protein
VKLKIFVSQVWINDLFTDLGEKNDMLTPWSFLTLCACVRVKPKIFPLSLNRNDLYSQT